MEVKIKDLSLDLTKTYVYEETEYILTGRTAVKEKSSPRRASRRRTRSVATEESSTEVMVEITPLKKQIGNPTDKKWVKPTDLFEISDELHEDDEP